MEDNDDNSDDEEKIVTTTMIMTITLRRTGVRSSTNGKAGWQHKRKTIRCSLAIKAKLKRIKSSPKVSSVPKAKKREKST
jgi:hypothetical protein